MPEKVLKFINCVDYDFMDNGKRVKGISCRCFNPDDNSIVKVKTERLLDYEFGDDIIVSVVIKGRYVNYEIA